MVRTARAPLRAWLALACAIGMGLGATSAAAQVSVSSSGSPAYGQAIAVPPGIGGMQPNLSLMYAGGGVNGPVGHGWSLQGISMVTRCPATRYTDGQPQGVVFGPGDKLCLDGQRLIQTDASGTVLGFPQTDDAKGLAGAAWREYRTEKDSYSRIRAYGTTGSDAANGPQYFKVWTKAGQIYEYGAPPSADGNTQAAILAQGRTVVMVWAAARISDVVGNYIDFKYENRDKDWGSRAYGTAGTGREWNVKEIQYTGNGAQAPRNKVVFRYSDRTLDAAESYQQGSKNVSVRQLDAIDTYINSPSTALMDASNSMGALFVKRVKIGYDNGPWSRRARVVTIADCVDPAGTRCMPPARFNYAAGDMARVASTSFNLASTKLSSMDGKYGVMAGDFNGDGRTDLLRWAENGWETQLLQSNGDGSFTSVATSLTSAGALNRADGCISSTVADTNGDGLVDIIRVYNDKNASGGSCGQTARAEFLVNQGGGNFTTRQLLDTANGQIAFKRQVSAATSRQFCGQVAAAGMDTRDLMLAVINDCMREGGFEMWVGYGWTEGATYYFMDVNGDGRMDIITTTLPARAPADPRDDPYADEEIPSCSGCTKVYLAQPDGRFALTATNVDNTPLYSDPGRFGALNSWTYVRDTNGDGLADLLSAGAPRKYRNWTSDGRGNFTAQSYMGDTGCTAALDFNGDGRADCLIAGAAATGNLLRAGYSSAGSMIVSNFNLTSSGKELSSSAGTVGQNYGVYAIDVSGDGRDDLIRWHDNPLLNKLYLSNGDGTFSEVPMSALGEMSPMVLGQSDGTYDLLMGDFRGLGSVEFLRISRNAPDLSDVSKKNKLFIVNDTATTDRLVSYVSPTGLKTTLNYAPIASAEGRVTSDAATADKAQYPLMDLTLPGQIVASVDQEVGVGTQTVRTDYGYVGMKAAVDGRGMLGFRRTVQQNTAPNGEPLSVWTDFLLEEPYAGVAKRTQTRRGPWTSAGAQLLSQTVNVYCDKTSGTNPDAASVDTPCATGAKVTRPYLRQSVESGWDLNGTALPTVTTVNTYNDYGDPTSIVVTTTGTVAGVSGLASTKSTVNTYCAPDTAGCANKTGGDNWILGRLGRATVTNTVPKLIDTLTASAGNSPTATATAGNQQTNAPVNPAVLQAILQLLLDD